VAARSSWRPAQARGVNRTEERQEVALTQEQLFKQHFQVRVPSLLAGARFREWLREWPNEWLTVVRG
jgi:hypothetical protein